MLGFLSPTGELTECLPHGHMELADSILEHLYNSTSNTPVDTLCKLGWVVVQARFVGFAGDDISNSPELTGAQKEWLEINRDNMNGEQRDCCTRCLEYNTLVYEM